MNSLSLSGSCKPICEIYFRKKTSICIKTSHCGLADVVLG